MESRWIQGPRVTAKRQAHWICGGCTFILLRPRGPTLMTPAHVDVQPGGSRRGQVAARPASSTSGASSSAYTARTTPPWSRRGKACHPNCAVHNLHIQITPSSPPMKNLWIHLSIYRVKTANRARTAEYIGAQAAARDHLRDAPDVRGYGRARKMAKWAGNTSPTQ